ncbi:MAG: SDR family NAD(P)-dependent oxidoreductase [Christensenellales bacterium]|jgi:NAD(P)-dependent dehydrogenase (short-subunit alcohol dehydrogenase family)
MGKTVAVVTGATSGIGRSAAEQLAARGIAVIAIGRNAQKCNEAKEYILSNNPKADIQFMLCDLASQNDITRLAGDISASIEKLDIFINAAGAVSSRFTTTQDGIELQLAVNHLAPFLITHLLLKKLKAARRARVITVSSASHYGTRLDFSDLQMQNRYSCLGQYKRTKLCNVMFSAEINRRFFEPAGIRAFAADPGLVNTDIGCKGTSGIEKAFWSVRRRGGVSPDVPGEHLAKLALNDEAYKSGGLYWKNGAEKMPSRYSLLERPALLLWQESLNLCKIGRLSI